MKWGIAVDAVWPSALNRSMKSLPVLVSVLLLVLLGAGCARNYNIITHSGRSITTKGKPKYDEANSSFKYTDVRGEARTIPAGSVREIAPASDAKDPTRFNPQPGR